MHEILGIGNAICDILVKVEDEVLQKFNLIKGSMSLCSESINQEILSYLQNQNYKFKICSGGSVANTINYLSKYDVNTAFLGNVANGFYGNKFRHGLAESNIKFYNTYDNSDETAKCIVLVTEDGERTMCTSLGCAANLDVESININEICKSKYIYIEGYLWDNPKAIHTITTIVRAAKKYNAQIVFSLADSFCVERHHKDFQDFINNYVDILFGNEAEICALFELKNFNYLNALLIQKQLSNINTNYVITTQHNNGCTIIKKNNILPISTIEKKAIDSTGAGDSFVAGFLYGIIRNLDITTSANIANFIAGQVIEHLGARPEIILPKTKQDLITHTTPATWEENTDEETASG